MSSRPLKVVWRAMAGVRSVFALALACVIISASVSLVDPLVMRFTLDSVLARKAPELPPPLDAIVAALGGSSYLARNLWLCGLALLAASLVNAVFSFLRGNLAALAAERTTKNLRDRLAAHIDALPASYFGAMGAGDLIQRATSDVDTVRRFLSTQVEEVGRAVALLGLTVVMMASIDLPMTLVSVPVIPAVFAFSYLFFRKIQKAFTVSDEAEAALTQVLEENLHGIRVVRAFARERFEIERFDARNRRFTGETRKLIVLFGWYWGVSVLLCAAQEATTIGVGAARVAAGQLTAGTYIAFIAYVGRILWPVRQLGRTLTEVGKAMVSLGRIAQVLEVPDEFAADRAVDAAAAAAATPVAPPARPRGRVEVDRLCVEHEPGKPVLKDVSFVAEPGETIAILGKTGSGKSTLAVALVRLVEASSGSIKIDGTDIRLYDRRRLREIVGLVLQEPYLFSRSLRENVELGTGRLPDAELERASRLSGLDPAVAAFEAGWDTAVGEEGVTLSGGQRQRLALARTLAKRPRVLVLDDTLSALDTETDAAVRRALGGEASVAARAAGTAPTTIIVAHRITTLMGADRILVLEEGRVADMGTHAELVGRPGLYRRVWEIQSAGRENRMEEIDSKQAIRLSLWRSLFKFAAPFKKDLAFLCLMMVLVAAIDAAQPFLTGWAVDNIAVAGRLDRLTGFAIVYCSLMAVQAIAIRLFIGAGGRIEMGMNYGIRAAAFERLQALSFSYFDRTSAGWITARLTSDIGRLADIITWGLIDMIWGASMMIISAALMLATDWRLALFALSAFPLLIVASMVFEKAILERSREVRKHNSKLTAAFSENIRGVRAVKALVAEERQGAAFRRLSETMRRASVRQARLSALYLPLVVFLGYIGMSLSLWQGGERVLAGTASIGLLTAFIFSAARFFDPATDLARVIADLQYAQASAERVVGLLETKSDIVDGSAALDLEARLAATGEKRRLRGEIEFEEVSFSYDGRREVLSSFSLKVEPGSAIALVGETGSGKSTIVNLACRFYEPTAGRILVDGTDYRELPLSLLHGNLGYVLQQPYLFSGTVRDNIRYGRLEAGDAEIEAAARAARAHDFIAGSGGARGLEGGYSAQVGEGGLLLSTGQKQLISLARAILADPAILVLDEATSSVDTETERLVQDAIATLLAGRTSFVVAHRLSTIIEADLILVLRAGRVVEQGKHSELLEAGGYYRRLYFAQFAREEERSLFGAGAYEEEAGEECRSIT